MVNPFLVALLKALDRSLSRIKQYTNLYGEISQVETAGILCINKALEDLMFKKVAAGVLTFFCFSTVLADDLKDLEMSGFRAIKSNSSMMKLQ